MTKHKHTGVYNYDGTIFYTYNMFDENVKECNFSLISDYPMTYNEIKLKAIEQCQRELGLAQCIKQIQYQEKLQ